MAYNPQNPNGQASMANSSPVAIASDQSAVPVTLQAATTGGDSSYHLVSASGTNLTNIKDGQGKVTGWFIYNNATSGIRNVVFYNSSASSSPIVGTTTPLFSLVIPALNGANVSFPDGINFSSGIWIATTNGIADNTFSGVSAEDFNINIFYK